MRVRDAGADISTLDETVLDICGDLNLPAEVAANWRDPPRPDPEPAGRSSA